MTTRADLRSKVRRRLEDTGGSPLWSDETLDDVLADAVGQYGVRFPREVTMPLNLVGGETVITVAAEVTGMDIIRVRDGHGMAVERMKGERDNASGRQAWRFWAGNLVLSRPAQAGTWEIDHFVPATLPADDVTTLVIPSGDEEIIVVMASAAALFRRSVEQGKRGLERAGLALAKVAEIHTGQAERMMASRRRRAWGGWIDG